MHCSRTPEIEVQLILNPVYYRFFNMITVYLNSVLTFTGCMTSKMFLNILKPVSSVEWIRYC